MIAACACNKESRFITDMPITMSLTEAGSTKALLDETTFETTGNQIKIYDYYSGGSIPAGYYINDVIQCATLGNWPFVNETHKWTTDGVHSFFGWLIKDNYAILINARPYKCSHKILRDIPEKNGF